MATMQTKQSTKGKSKASNKASYLKKGIKGLKKPLKAASVKPIKKGPLVVKEAFNHSLLIKTLVEHTNLGKKEVLSVLEALKDIMVAHLSKKGPQKFKLKGLFMAKIKDKPATKARKGRNPFTGEDMMFAAKPGRRVVKINALQPLKKAI